LECELQESQELRSLAAQTRLDCEPREIADGSRRVMIGEHVHQPSRPEKNRAAVNHLHERLGRRLGVDQVEVINGVKTFTLNRVFLRQTRAVDIGELPDENAVSLVLVDSVAQFLYDLESFGDVAVEEMSLPAERVVRAAADEDAAAG